MLARLLFILFLIFAFAQPYFTSKQKDQINATAIYIDNSQSMSLRIGQRTLLDIAKENAIRLIQNTKAPFYVITNDKANSYSALSQQQAFAKVQSIGFSFHNKSNLQMLQELTSMLPNASGEHFELFYLSDFQQNSFLLEAKEQLGNMLFNGVVVSQPSPNNIWIDTAYFEYPNFQLGQSNLLIVKSKYYGETIDKQPILKLTINGQLKGALTPNYNQFKESADTFSFQINEPSWQKIVLTIDDNQVHFDDSFLIAAHSSSELSVLVLNEGVGNPYLQAALRSNSSFKVFEKQLSDIPKDLTPFSLVIFNGITVITKDQVNAMNSILQYSHNVLLFVGNNFQVEKSNTALQQLADIRFGELDTNKQSVTEIQKEHPLVFGIFDRIPDNVQLPYTKAHFEIKSGLSANQQSIFSFRNGGAFFAQYGFSNGKLFLCATPINNEMGNFQTSYFFMPFLYQMASLAQNNNVYALTIGNGSSIYIQQANMDEKGLFHLIGNNIDGIPIQKAEGLGTKIFIDPIEPSPGFYDLKKDNEDPTVVAVNLNRFESDLKTWTLQELKQNWTSKRLKWQQIDSQKQILDAKEQSTFSLWKLCAILALIMLGIETYLLSRNLLNKDRITN